MTLRDLLRNYVKEDSAAVTNESDCSMNSNDKNKSGSVQDIDEDITNWPEEWKEEFDEIAGKLEYDAGLCREAAEIQAKHTILKKYTKKDCA